MACDPSNVANNPESAVQVLLGKFAAVYSDLRAAGDSLALGGNITIRQSGRLLRCGKVTE
jgi:hypothetical protein